MATSDSEAIVDASTETRSSETRNLAPRSDSTAGFRADVGSKGSSVVLSVTGPAVVGAGSSMLGVSVLVWGNPLQLPAHFWLAMLASTVVGGTLSLLLTNSRINDFRERIEDLRRELRESRDELDRKDARIRSYEEAVLTGRFTGGK